MVADNQMGDATRVTVRRGLILGNLIKNKVLVGKSVCCGLIWKSFHSGAWAFGYQFLEV